MGDTVKEDALHLAQAAAGWDGVSDELGSARLDIAWYQNSGSNFGWFATRAHIDTQHNNFIKTMIDALDQGGDVTTKIANTIRDIATDFGNTDNNVSDQFHNVDGTPK